MIKLPSAFTISDAVIVSFWNDLPKLRGLIHGVHFYEGKVKYDITVLGPDDMETRIYNVDSAFVSGDLSDPKPEEKGVHPIMEYALKGIL